MKYKICIRENYLGYEKLCQFKTTGARRRPEHNHENGWAVISAGENRVWPNEKVISISERENNSSPSYSIPRNGPQYSTWERKEINKKFIEMRDAIRAWHAQSPS